MGKFPWDTRQIMTPIETPIWELRRLSDIRNFPLMTPNWDPRPWEFSDPWDPSVGNFPNSAWYAKNQKSWNPQQHSHIISDPNKSHIGFSQHKIFFCEFYCHPQKSNKEWISLWHTHVHITLIPSWVCDSLSLLSLSSSRNKELTVAVVHVEVFPDSHSSALFAASSVCKMNESEWEWARVRQRQRSPTLASSAAQDSVQKQGNLQEGKWCPKTKEEDGTKKKRKVDQVEPSFFFPTEAMHHENTNSDLW